VLNLDLGKAWLDIRDPQRSTTDLAYRIFDYKVKANVPYYEFWPHPTGGQEYVALYKAKGLAFTSGSQGIPDVIPEGLLIDRALGHYAYRWAAINAGRDPKLAKTNWLGFKRDADANFEIDVQKAKLEDDNIIQQTIIGPMGNKGWPPVDAAFLQAHSTGLEPFI
jgi:hypothetical protein